MQLKKAKPTDNSDASLMNNATGKDVKIVAASVNHDSMAGIVTALAARSHLHVIFADEVVDNLPLPLIAPLRAKQYRCL